MDKSPPKPGSSSSKGGKCGYSEQESAGQEVTELSQLSDKNLGNRHGALNRLRELLQTKMASHDWDSEVRLTVIKFILKNRELGTYFTSEEMSQELRQAGLAIPEAAKVEIKSILDYFGGNRVRLSYSGREGVCGFTVNQDFVIPTSYCSDKKLSFKLFFQNWIK